MSYVFNYLPVYVFTPLAQWKSCLILCLTCDYVPTFDLYTDHMWKSRYSWNLDINPVETDVLSCHYVTSLINVALALVVYGKGLCNDLRVIKVVIGGHNK